MSNVTPILTGRVNLKRLTSNLLDAIAPAASLTVDRQPVSASFLEVVVRGATVTSGSVTVIGNIENVISQLVLQDRVLAVTWAMRSDDGVVSLTEITNVCASNEPIVEDSLNSNDHWKIFVSDGIVGVESSAVSQNDSVVLADQTDMNNYKVVVSDGFLGLYLQSSREEHFSFCDNKAVLGSDSFYSISGITVSGITNGFIEVKAVDGIGQPVRQETTIQASMPVRIYTKRGKMVLLKSGDQITEGTAGIEFHMMAEPNANILQKDLVYILSGVSGLTRGEVGFFRHIYDFAGMTHHLEAELRRT